MIKMAMTSQFFIMIAIFVLIVVLAMVFFLNKNKKQEKLSSLAGLAFGCIIAGMVFGDNRILGYSLFGLGVIFAVIDMVVKSRKK